MKRHETQPESEIVILTRCFHYYRANPVMLIPVLVYAITAFLVGFAILQVLQGPLSSDTVSLNNVFFDLLPLSTVFLLGSFVVNVGLGALSAEVMRNGKCRLRDWGTGIKEYFWRTLTVSIVIFILFAFVSRAVSSLFEMNIMTVSSVHNLFSTLGSLITYLCYAGIMLDDANFQSSISRALKTVLASGRVFCSFFLLLFAVTEVRVLLAVDQSGIIASDFPSLPNAIAGPDLGYLVVWSLLLPLWFLIAFALHDSFPSVLEKGR